MVGEAVLILVLVSLSAFFSASETALTAVSRVRLERLIDEGAWWSKALIRWRDEPHRVLTAILIGNNLVNITASALATDMASSWLSGSPVAIPVAVGVMTFLILTFGEILPKSFAKARSEQLAGRMMWALRGPYLLFWLAAAPYAWLTRRIMLVFGTSVDDEGPSVTEEDIEYLVELGSREGTIEGNKEKILLSAFDYTETSVREIMVPRTEVQAVNRMATLAEIIEFVILSGYTRAPVYGEDLDEIVGLIYAKDLLKHFHSGDARFDIERYLRPAYFVPEQKKVSDLLTDMQTRHVHMAVAVDEFGGTAGIVTLEDIVEEFFGEIRDEYDDEPEHFKDLGEGRCAVDARAPLTSVEGRYDIEFPEHPEYDSLGGFLVSQTGTLPAVGYEISEGRLSFRVTKADETRVIEVEIVDLGPDYEAPDEADA
jgi:putative hemolysin